MKLRITQEILDKHALILTPPFPPQRIMIMIILHPNWIAVYVLKDIEIFLSNYLLPTHYNHAIHRSNLCVFL